MEISQLQSYIEQGEGQEVEFKTSFAEENEAIKSLCAFSNAKGGHVLFGVENNGNIVGVTLGKNTLETFANNVQSHTQPPIHPTIEQCNVEGKKVVIASVQKAGEGTIFWAFNKPYIRVGKTNQVLSPENIKKRHYKSFLIENARTKKTDSSLKNGPVRIKSAKENMPEYLMSLTTGRQILGFIRESYAFAYRYDELTTQEEIDLIGDFLQSIQELHDVLSDIEMKGVIQIEYDLTATLQDIEKAGFFVFGGKEMKMLEGGGSEPSLFPTFLINIMRKTNPEIISIPVENKEPDSSR